jgi:hypothetical protein
VSRRGLLWAGVAGGAVLVAGGVGGVAALAGAMRHRSAQSSGGNGWDPNSLPTAGGAGGIGTADVQALLDRHNTALRGRDETGFLAAFEAGSSVAANAKALFANLGKVPFDTAQYQLIGQAGRVFAGADGASAQVDVAFVHKITGVDVKPVTEWYRWTLSRRTPQAPLTITAVTGSPTINGSTRWVYYPAIWDLGPLTVIKRGAALLAAADSKDAAVMASIAGIAGQAANDNHTGWQGPAGVSPGLFIVGTSSRDVFYELYSGRANQHGNEAGLTVPMLAADSVDTATTNPVCGGARITLDLTTSYFTDNHGADKPLTLLRHEGAHALVAPLLTARPDPPLWVVEGFAEYMASRFDPPTAENFIPALRQYAVGSKTNGFAGKWDGATLPTDDLVYNASLITSDANYALATLAYRFIAQHGGQVGVCAFVAGNYQAAGRDDVGAVLQKVVGMDLSTFQAQWASFVHATVRV